jgi:hypothetical protein
VGVVQGAPDNPEIWRSNRPAKSGETGAMLAEIVARAAAIKAARRPAARKRQTRRR